MFSSPSESSTPSLYPPIQPEGNDFDQDLVQAFQENQTLREHILQHAQLMQLLTHQLATPLTALNGAVHLLGEPSLAQEQRQEFLEVIQQKLQSLTHLLRDLMALRNVETGKIATQPTSFCFQTLVKEVIAELAPYPVMYQFEAGLPQVWGDRWQISQVLVNFLSNAIKYSPAGQAIDVGAVVKQSGWVEIWVQDYGLGVPEADQPHLFNRFYRVKHGDRQNIEGTGLGLSLCKLLVENQGGQIGFESIHGAGSRFYFTLPITPPFTR
ncbi:HAMP domain-containing histidine kinase [Phormidium sp. CLA17]|uniref:sensor histidine kinase n=1 Tax=Leptolyngbya sp. Cla-17 TaxID=2803751 RepID=UPI001492AEE9|nr:HAMP domain-containing sensor histidine kinase [Leptolyngbya sp. Cla-17]MBM0743853.1 HAMP domain-containing histidine kinase [Leptolyngbya sp. Cla-17]